jgi:OOP family OmpA-OmpF porin
MTAIGYGEEKPVASNDTVEGRDENRRIEVTLSK